MYRVLGIFLSKYILEVLKTVINKALKKERPKESEKIPNYAGKVHDM